MSASYDRGEQLNVTLRRLERYTSLSPFCRLFYRFLFGVLREEPSESVEKLQQAFHLFLRCECRRHEAVRRIVHKGKLDLVAALRSGRQSHELFEIIRQQTEKMELATPKALMIRELLLAECHYHLGNTRQVVECLGNAISRGCSHPLVHFARGYNMYVLAMQKFTRAGDQKGLVVAEDPVAFQNACREAIHAFQKGLGDINYDAQIYWWIGLLWEMLGERAEAREAFKCAMDADPEHFATQSEQKLAALAEEEPMPPLVQPFHSEAEAQRLKALPPITETELRETRRYMRTRKYLKFEGDE